MDGELWIGLLKIILINIVLSGDNAVVIALASRKLPPSQQRKAVFWGSFGAIALRVLLTFAAVELLKVPFLQAIGGVLLIWIAIKLLADDHAEENVKSGSNLGEAVRTIILADLVMSLDNVVAVAGAAQGNMTIILIGLALSVPLIIWGSQLLMRLMHRYPIIVWLGAALLGFTAGEMFISDQGMHPYLRTMNAGVHALLPAACTLLVVIAGKLRAAR